MIKNKSKTSIILIVLTGLTVLLISGYIFYRNILESELQKEIALDSKNVDYFIDQNISVSKTTQKQWTVNFREKFFSPWNNPEFHFTREQIHQKQNNLINKFSKNPGWSIRKHPHSSLWIENIAGNMQIKIPFNTNKNAITVRYTDLRILPTIYPSFTNWVDPGEGYPFDNLQESRLHANLPIFVLHTSQDKQWSLVITAEQTYGWVKNNDIAYVTKEFINEWLNSDFVVSTKDNIPLMHENNLEEDLKIGILLPIKKENTTEFITKLAFRDKNGYADIKHIPVNKAQFKKWPMKANAIEIAKIIEELQDKQYGWGGLLGERDCSSLVRDIFTNFGYWLPRNTSNMLTKNSIFIGNLDNSTKEEKIIDSATPFLNLLWFRGHVMIYLGHHLRETYSFHSIWGLRTHEIVGKDGRAIIGKSLIQKNNSGKHKKLWIKNTLLERVTQIIPIS